MLIKRLFLICSLTAFIAGCSEFYGTQPPAPVYGNGATIYSQPEPYPPIEETPTPVAREPEPVVETKPLQEFVPKKTPIELKPEPLPPPEQNQETLTPEQERELLSLGQTPQPPAPEQTPTPTPPKANPDAAAPAPAQETVKPAPAPPPPPPPPPPSPPFQPLETFAPLSPAVGALVVAANQNSKSGNIESATTTIERAIRIEPRNATLYYKLALLRLKQSKPRLAEDLAKKSALLASGDTRLKKHSWLLIAKAREMQKNYQGAKEARAKADAL